MGRLKLNAVTFIALVAFIAALGIRRVIVRDHLEEMRLSVEVLKSHEKLQDRIDELMGLLHKSDASLRGLVISQDPAFLNGFEDGIISIGITFDEIKHSEAAVNVLGSARLFRLDSLLFEKVEFMQHLKELCDDNKFDLASDKISTGLGKKLADSLGNVISRSRNELESLINATEGEFSKQTNKEATFSLISFIALIVLLACFLYLLHLEMRKNEKFRSQLIDHHEKLSVTLDGIADGVLTTDASGNINYLNLVAEILLAQKLSEVEGTHLNKVFTITNEETNEPVQDIFDRVVVKGLQLLNQNHTILHSKNKNRYTIENSAAPLRDADGIIMGMVLVFRDVTERNHIMQARLIAEREYRQIFEQVTQGIYRSTMDGELMLTNPSFAKIFEYESPADIISSIAHIGNEIYLYPEDRIRIIDQLRKNGRVDRVEVQAKTKTGRIIWILVNAHVLKNSEDQDDYVEGTVTDITERKRDQEKLLAQYNSLRQYSFINSHEVRARVATILGLTNLCIEDYVSVEEKNKIIENLNGEALQLDKIIRKLSTIVNKEIDNDEITD